MIEQVPIQYREFYDIPRMFVVQYAGVKFLFDGSFDDKLDDYPSEYAVYALSSRAQESMGGNWSELSRDGRRITTIPTSQVTFDETRRASINNDVLERVADAMKRRVA